MKQKQVQAIADDLNKRMAGYTHSMQPTNDEVSIAFLLCHIEELKVVIDSTLAWWKEHEYDTMGAMGDYNVYDKAPKFVQLAQEFEDDDIQDSTSLHVHYWCEGTWCLGEDLHEYGHMSDDYTVIELPDTTTSEEIESIVQQRLGIGSFEVTVEEIDTTNGCKQCSLYNNQDRCPPDCGGNP